MLTHNPSPKSARWRYALILPLLSLSLYFSACTREVVPTANISSKNELSTRTEKANDFQVYSVRPAGYRAKISWVAKEEKTVEVDLEKNETYIAQISTRDQQGVDGLALDLLDENGNVLAHNVIADFTGEIQVPFKNDEGKTEFREKQVDGEDVYFPIWTYKCKKTGKYKLRLRAEETPIAAVMTLGVRSTKASNK